MWLIVMETWKLVRLFVMLLISWWWLSSCHETAAGDSLSIMTPDQLFWWKYFITLRMFQVTVVCSYHSCKLWAMKLATKYLLKLHLHLVTTLVEPQDKCYHDTNIFLNLFYHISLLIKWIEKIKQLCYSFITCLLLRSILDKFFKYSNTKHVPLFA